MASPAEIQAQLDRGWSVFLDMKSKDYDKARGGCLTCGDSMTQCLFLISTGLQWRVDQGVYDSTTDKLYTDMMEIIGPGDVVYGPRVDAGPSQTIEQPMDSVTLNGTVIAGDNPIDQQGWVQISGPNQGNIINPSSESTVVDGLIPGVYVFKLTAVDTVGKFASDTTTVSVIAANMVAYYWNQDTPSIPNISAILGSPFVAYVSGEPITITFDKDGPRYSGVAYLASEPVKTQWIDTVEFSNNGTIGADGDLFAPQTLVSNLRVTITQYKTEFNNPIRFQ